MDFEEHLAEVRIALAKVHVDISHPVHALVPEQPSFNATLRKVLDRTLDDANKVLAKATAIVARYAAAALALERNGLLRQRIDGEPIILQPLSCAC